MLTNPLRDPLDRRLPRIPEPCALVIFGVTGDLARKKLLPGHLRPGQPGAAAARLRGARLRPARLGRRRLRDDGAGGGAGARPHAVAGGGVGPAGRQHQVRRRVVRRRRRVRPPRRDAGRACATSHGIQGNAAFYLSIPPAAFPVVLKQMQRTGMADNERSGGWRRVVVEKPFGHDLASARELNELVDDVFTPPDVFRIDHYLGKETVQNILALRFANALFEPVWDSRYVDSVQITMAEDVGIGTRAGFYDTAGAARDVLQNHLMQLLALVAMEEPTSFDAGRDPHREAQGAAGHRAARRHRHRHGARPVPAGLGGRRAGGRLPRGAGRPADLHHRDLRGGAAGHPEPALGRGAVLHPYRQAPAAPGHRDRGPVQEGAAPAVPRRRRGAARQQPAGHPGAAGRGRHAQVRLEGARHRRWRSATSPWTSSTARRSPSPARRRTSGWCSTCCSATRRCSPTPRRSRRAGGSSTRWRRPGPAPCPFTYRAGEWGPRAADEMLARDGRPGAAWTRRAIELERAIEWEAP